MTRVCIRGCVRRTVGNASGEIVTVERPAGDGWLCASCYGQLTGMLDEIPALAAHAPDTYELTEDMRMWARWAWVAEILTTATPTEGVTTGHISGSLDMTTLYLRTRLPWIVEQTAVLPFGDMVLVHHRALLYRLGAARVAEIRNTERIRA